jgi:ribonuclease J
VTGPDVTTRGWIHESDTGSLVDGCAAAVGKAIDRTISQGKPLDIEALQKVIRKEAGRFVADRTKRRPMIVPVVVEV